MKSTTKSDEETVLMPTNRVKGSVCEGEAGKRVKTTHQTNGEMTTRTNNNPFEK